MKALNNSIAIDTRSTIAATLKKMNSNVTVSDKHEAAQLMDVSYNTILNYMRGDVANVEIGLRLMEFFNGIINNRIERVKQVIAA